MVKLMNTFDNQLYTTQSADIYKTIGLTVSDIYILQHLISVLGALRVSTVLVVVRGLKACGLYILLVDMDTQTSCGNTPPAHMCAHT